MSRLYIRLMTGFYSHRKTLRLKARIGNDALWVVPRIWSYAAENQPDGDLSGYEDAEIALLVAYTGDAQALLQALKECGFVDSDGKIHGWHEHNGYHQTFAARAKTAADARWGKKEKNQKKEDTDIDKDKEASNASSISQASPSIPTALKSELFEETWGKWMKFRRGMKKPGDWNALFSEQLQWLSRFQQATAIEILNQSIRNGWQGLFEPKENNHASKNTSLNPAADRRNAGTIKGITDYGEAGRRKLVRQSEERARRLGESPAQNDSPPSQTQPHGV